MKIIRDKNRKMISISGPLNELDDETHDAWCGAQYEAIMEKAREKK